MSRSKLTVCLLAAALALGAACVEDNRSFPSEAGVELDVGHEADTGEPSMDASVIIDAGPEDSGIDPPDCGSLTACGVICTSLDDDPLNCGVCGRTCIIPRAEAACVARECAVGACNEGFLDVDGEVENGCEVEDSCVPDVACPTSCGTEGRSVCMVGTSTCTPPLESCNMVDDDCNTECDEGPLAGCRKGVHRAFGNGHLYTADLSQASTTPFSLEVMNYFYVYANALPETRPLFLCRKGNGKYLITDDTGCEMIGALIATVGYLSATEACGSVPLYRLYSAAASNHFFTLSANERDNAINNLGYVSEGIAGYVWTSP